MYDDFKKVLSTDQVADFAIDMVFKFANTIANDLSNNVNNCLNNTCLKNKEIGGINLWEESSRYLLIDWNQILIF